MNTLQQFRDTNTDFPELLEEFGECIALLNALQRELGTAPRVDDLQCWIWKHRKTVDNQELFIYEQSPGVERRLPIDRLRRMKDLSTVMYYLLR